MFKILKWSGIGFISLMVLIVLLMMLLPQAPLPSPTGKYNVGFTQFDLKENQGKSNSQIGQWVAIDAWYPAQDDLENNKQLKYTDQALATALSSAYKVPSAVLKDERLLDVFVDAKPNLQRFPVIIFNHGHGSFAKQNQLNLIELASHGYIALAISHPQFSLLVQSSDRGDFYNNSPLLDMKKERLIEIATGYQKGFNDLRVTENLEQWQTQMQFMEQQFFSEIFQEFDQWIVNNELLIGKLESINNNHPILKQRLNLDQLAVLGHSFGGSVSTYLATHHDNISAAVNLDGPVFSKTLNGQFKTPICFAYANQNTLAGINYDFSWVNRELAKQYNGCEALFKGAAHMNFSDLNQLPFLKYAGLLGPIDTNTMSQSLNRFLVSYFDRQFKQKTKMPNLPEVTYVEH